MESWQELNVTAFLISGISGTQKIIGKPYIDGNGSISANVPTSDYDSFSNGRTIKRGLKKCDRKSVTIYTQELFTTYNDEDNHAEITIHKTEELNLVGIGIRGKKNPLDKITKGLEMH